MSEYDWIFDRIPHRGPMRFLDEVVRVDAESIRTRTTLRDNFLMAREGSVSTLVAIELFAQSAAAQLAFRTADANAPGVQGALLGTRKLDVTRGTLSVGETVETEARQIFGAGPLAQFECTLFLGEEAIATGTVNVVSGADVVNG